MKLTQEIKRIILRNAARHYWKVKPLKLDGKELQVSKKDQYFAAYSARRKAVLDYERERDDYMDNLKLLLGQFATTEELLKAWPRINPLLEGVVTEVKSFKLVIAKGGA